MSVPNRRWLYLFLSALFVLAVVAIPLAILSRSHSKRLAAVLRQQATVEPIRQRGGTVVLGPSGKSGLPPDVISVDLSRTVVDAELMQTLGQFTRIQRLTLDGAKLQPHDWALLGKLPRLQTLSLSRSNITDASVSQLPLGLTNLTLNGTAVTDKSMSRLAAISGLTYLDIADTQVTPDGLRLLAPLTSLARLWIDESCITAQSAESLRLMQPQSVEVAVSEGMGRGTYDSLSVCKGSDIRGHHRDGYELWAADSAWSHTLAGVVEAVVLEIGLDSQQAVQLLEILGKEPPKEGWGPAVRGPVPSPSPVSYTAFSPDRGIEFASVHEFIRELQKSRDFDYLAVRRFAKEKFTASDVPQLLTTIRATQFSQFDRLIHFGPFLLVQHGIDNPEVLAELDRLLAHQESFVRLHTVCAFGYGGLRPFYSREEWTASQAADAFAVPRLVRICQDKSEIGGIRDDASKVLAEIADRRPEYAAEVISVLVELLDEDGPWHFSTSDPRLRVDISRLPEADTNAAIAVVPKLREMLKTLDEQLAGAPAASLQDIKSPNGAIHVRRLSVLEALSATAHHDPALAHEIALEYLSRMENGQPVGPLATLLSPDTPEANRMVVLALLGGANPAQGELASVAKKIRDWRTTRQPVDE